MNRFYWISLVGLLSLGIAACGRDAPPAGAPAPGVSDAQLQQIEEDEFRAREEREEQVQEEEQERYD